MWILKFTMSDPEGIFSKRNKKFKVKSFAYRATYYYENNYTFLSGILLVEGKEKNIKEFIKSLKEDKYISRLEVKGNLINCVVKKQKTVSDKRQEGLFFSLETIYIKPIFTDTDGTEHWELGSWDRKALENILHVIQTNYNGKLQSFRDTKISESDFLFFSLYPKLTQKQKEAFLLALHNGYYNFPRDIELKKLAGMSKISYTTFQFHLRNAEKKIMNSVGIKI
ncbi:MAG: helix-turn-helix domain-containing protein [Nanoarchaeota archaeon]